MGPRATKKVRRDAAVAIESPDETGYQMPVDAEELGSATTTEVDYTVVIRHRTRDGNQDLQLTTNDRAFYPFAQRWRYVIANRRRITRVTRDSLSNDISVWMSDVCHIEPTSFEARVKVMARSDIVEVEIPYSVESVGWAARIFPWEHALALLTRPFREETAPFTVVRCLPTAADGVPARQPQSLLVVRSGPGEIASRYELERECQMVVDTLGAAIPESAVSIVREPDRATLQTSMAQAKPGVVHLSGVDPYALEAISNFKVDPDNSDGFVLRKSDGLFDVLAADDLAKIVASAPVKPTLVALTSCFSASRLAGLSVASGARYAIGFLDTLTDADAMLFFGCFYRAWMNGWDVLAAFVKARLEWAAQASPQSAAGVVLWSARSLLVADAAETATSEADTGETPDVTAITVAASPVEPKGQQ